MIFYDIINYFYSYLLFSVIGRAVGIELANNTSKLVDFGVTEKHIERCIMVFREIIDEFYYANWIALFVKYMIFPYILDGFIMPHIIGILEKLNSRGNSE